MTEPTMEEEVKIFVRQFKNDELDFTKAENDDQQRILTGIISAMDDFERAESDLEFSKTEIGKIVGYQTGEDIGTISEDYGEALRHLSRFIKLAKINKLFSKKGEPPELINMKNLNSKLISQKDQLQKVLDMIFEEYPKIKEKYEKILKSVKVEEGKVE